MVPLPLRVYPAPPRTCMALDAQNSATLEEESLRSAMCPPSLRFCSSLDIVFIWNVTFSSHAWRPSHCLAISPILCWIA